MLILICVGEIMSGEIYINFSAVATMSAAGIVALPAAMPTASFLTFVATKPAAGFLTLAATKPAVGFLTLAAGAICQLPSPRTVCPAAVARSLTTELRVR